MSNENLPAEVQAITAMERNREKMIEAFTGQQESLMLSAGDTVRSWSQEKQLDFMNQFAFRVCSDENLAPCFQSVEGKRSIVQALRRSLETGLMIGGKHAYLVPQPKEKGGPVEARFSIKAEGYLAYLCGGRKPIFRDLKWGKVYENDEFRVDEAEGSVSHSHGLEERGKFVGVWVQIVKKNGTKQVFTFPLQTINKWKAVSRYPKNTWDKWFEEMAEQACIRHACSRFEDAKDALAEALEPDSPEMAVPEESTSIEERAEAFIPDLEATEEEKRDSSDSEPEIDDDIAEMEPGDLF